MNRVLATRRAHCPRYLDDFTASLMRATGPRCVHQNVMHHMGRNGKELRALLPFDALYVHQP
jgi:hypothetical protein